MTQPDAKQDTTASVPLDAGGEPPGGPAASPPPEPALPDALPEEGVPGGAEGRPTAPEPQLEAPVNTPSDDAVPSAPESGPESPVEPPAAETPVGDPPETTVAVAPAAAASGEPMTADAMPLVQVIEALLFSSDVPLSVGKLAETCGLDSTKPVKDTIAALNQGYEERQAAYRIEERAGGYQLLTLPQYAEYIHRLVRKKDEGRLTPAALETLAIVAYKQPIIRVDIEAIRGVACGEVLRSLMEHNLVKIVGRAEEVGRPMLYGTTRYFLEVFGLANIKDLPKAEGLKEPR